MLHAARKLACEPILKADKARERHQLLKLGLEFVSGKAAKPAEEGKVLEYGEFFIESGFLGHKPDGMRKALVFCIGSEAKEADAAGIRAQYAGQEPQERGFPGAVRTHNRSEFTFRRQFQIEMIDGSKGRAVRAREGLNEPSDNERQRLSHAANSAAAQTQRSRAARAEAGSPDLVR